MSTFSSLPPNFVSLQKLQEQRLQDQEQKKKQEEAEERRRLKKEIEGNNVKEEEFKAIPNGFHRKNREKGTWVQGEVVIRTIPNEFHRKNRLYKEKSVSSKSPEPEKLEEGEIKSTSNGYHTENLQEKGEEPIDLEKSKMMKAERTRDWHMKKTVRRRSKLKEPLAAVGDRSTEEKLSSLNPTVEVDADEGKEEVELDAKGFEVDGERSKDGNQQWRRKPPNSKVLHNSTTEIVQRIGAISVIDDDEKMRRRSTVEMNGGFRGGRRFGKRGGDRNLRWVKKNEVTPSNGGAFC